MKHLSWTVLVFCAASLGWADPIPTLQLVPSAGTVNPGDMVTLNLNIVGLGSPGSMEVGSFDSFIGFDPALLSPTGATFTSLLGDPSLFLAITAFDSSPGLAEAADVSLLSTADLDAMQPSSFTLATYSFTALESGTVDFNYKGGPVDNGDGVLIAGSKTVVPEPSSLLLLLTGLASGSALTLRRKVKSLRRTRSRCIVLLGILLCAAVAGRADSSAIAKANPPNDPKYPQVKTACKLTVKNVKGSPSQGTLEQECVFTNLADQGSHFLYCSMLGLKNKTGANRKAPANSPNWGLQPVPAGGNTYKCTSDGNTGDREYNSGWHFGCQEVTIPKGKGSTAKVSFTSANSKSGSTVYKPPAGAMINTLKADDFEISYSDTIQFTAAVTKYDPASCAGADATHKDLNSQDTFLVPSSDFAAYWLQHHQEFKDPISQYLTLTATPPGPCDINGDGMIDISDINAIMAKRNTKVSPGSPGDADGDGMITANDARICVPKINKVYSLYDNSPCLPPAFPASVPDLPKCQPTNAPSTPLVADLNLYDAITMWVGNAGTQYPAILDVSTSGTATARLDIDPDPGKTFLIPGGEELYGYAQACSISNLSQCLPAVQSTDGLSMDYVVNVRDPSTGSVIVFQEGEFIQDGAPPVVNALSTTFDSSHDLSVQLTATDAATSPIEADFWFSIDQGLTWNHASLDPQTDILNEPSTQIFRGIIGTFTPGQPIQYFVSVQDVVYNIAYVGIGTITP